MAPADLFEKPPARGVAKRGLVFPPKDFGDAGARPIVAAKIKRLRAFFQQRGPRRFLFCGQKRFASGRFSFSQRLNAALRSAFDPLAHGALRHVYYLRDGFLSVSQPEEFPSEDAAIFGGIVNT